MKKRRSQKPLPLGEVALRSNDGEGKPVTTEPLHRDRQALCQSDAFAAFVLFSSGLALSVTFGDTSPIGRGTGVPVRPTRDEESLLYPETVVPCYRDSQQLDKGYCPEAAALCSRALFFV